MGRWTTFHPAVFLITFTSYGLFHIARKTLSYVKANIVGEWTPSANPNLTHPAGTWWRPDNLAASVDGAEAFLGLLNSVFLFSYAVGLYLSGTLADRLNTRLFLCSGMLLSAAVMLTMGPLLEWTESYSRPVYLVLMGVNGLLQSTGWPCVVSAMGNWFDRASRGVVLGLWSSSPSVGSVVGALLASLLVGYGYEYVFLLSASMLLGGSVIVFFGLVVSPREVGLPMADESSSSTPSRGSSSKEDVKATPVSKDPEGSIKERRRRRSRLDSLCSSGWLSSDYESANEGSPKRLSFKQAQLVHNEKLPRGSYGSLWKDDDDYDEKKRLLQPSAKGGVVGKARKKKVRNGPDLKGASRIPCLENEDEADPTDFERNANTNGEGKNGFFSVAIEKLDEQEHENSNSSSSKHQAKEPMENCFSSKKSTSLSKLSNAVIYHKGESNGSVDKNESLFSEDVVDLPVVDDAKHPLKSVADKRHEGDGGEAGDGKKAEAATERPKAIGFFKALLLPKVINYSLAYAFLKLVNYVFFFWLPFYLSSSYGWTQAVSDRLSVWYDVGGVLGGTVAGYVAYRLDLRALIMGPLLTAAIPLLYVYETSAFSRDMAANGVQLGVLGFLIAGVSNIMSAAISTDLARQEAVQGNLEALSTVSGIIEGTGSLSSALGQIAVPYLNVAFGWGSVFYFMMVSLLITVLNILPIIVAESKGVIRRIRG